MPDAPVTGGEKGAIEGTLGIMVGGRKQVFEECLPILKAMGKRIAYTGLSGNGQKTKLVNQLVGATNLIAVAEGLRLARATGLDPDVTMAAISSGAASSWMLVNLGPLILKRDFAPGFSIRLQFKDLKLLMEWISESEEEFPAASLAYELFKEAVEMGFEKQGNQGLINIWPSK
jgi:3-hydroxyisobutyrate dehydrogenase